jgi:hypothetical protein
MVKLIHLAAVAAVMPLMLSAQVPHTEAPPAPDSGKSGASEPALIEQPSRYVGAHVDDYVKAMVATLSIQSRSTDPFGQVQDPTAEAAKPQPVAPATRPAVLPPVPYSEVVSQIRVTTVIPGENRFLVGTRSFKTGDRFPLAYRGRNFPSEVVEVSAHRIVIKNVANSELGIVRLDLLPAGMTKGIQPAVAPGLQKADANAPLELDPENASGTNPNP